jgi:hypothetical protein
MKKNNKLLFFCSCNKKKKKKIMENLCEVKALGSFKKKTKDDKDVVRP